MQIFGIDLWRIILCIVLIFLVVKRAGIVALFAKRAFGKGDNEKAIRIFKIANTIGNLNVENRLSYSYILLRSGYVDEAQLELRKLLPYTSVKSRDRYRVKNLLALTLWKQDKLSEAIEEMEEIIADDYKNTLIYQNLGILYNLSDAPVKALAFNKEAYEYNSDDNIITDNLADAYHLNGDLEKSAEIYEQLIARDPEPRFPEAYYGYGRVLIALGKKTEGIEMIEKSLTKTFSYLSIKTKEDVEEMLSTLRNA